MNNLPIELFHHIFGYIDLIDLTNCKLVDKKFYKIVMMLRIKELVLSGYNYRSKYFENWIYTNRLVNYNYLIDSKLINHKMLNLIYLRKLKIDYAKSNLVLNLRTINRFKLLNELSIKCVNLNIVGFKLSLSNLITFQFIVGSERIDPIQLDTPKLEAVFLNRLSTNMHFNYPLSIKYLCITLFSPNILKFKNLEYLKCESNITVTNLLNELLNLKHFVAKSTDFHTITFLKNLMHQKSSLKRTDLKIFCECFQIFNSQDIEQISHSHGRQLISFVKNYDKLDYNLYSVYGINFNSFTRFFKFSEDFFLKMNCIQLVKITKPVTNQNYLLTFLSNCLNLSKLIIKDAKLDLDFYDRLPQVCSLVFLQLLETEDIKLNFEFVSRMFNLQELKTNQQLSLNETFALDRLKYLKVIVFKTRHPVQEIKVIKIKRNSYGIFVDKDLKSTGLTFKQLIKQCDRWNKRTIDYITRSRSKRLKVLIEW